MEADRKALLAAVEAALTAHTADFTEQPESFDSTHLVAENVTRYLAPLLRAAPAPDLLAAVEALPFDPVPPYHDDRGDLQEAWVQGYHAAARALLRAAPSREAE